MSDSDPGRAAMVDVEDLAHGYGGATVLRIETLRMERGARWLIAGPSGSGKTTLLAILAGLLRPSQGSVVVDGQVLASMKEGSLDAWRGQVVGYVPQKLHLIPSLSVLQNLLLAQYLAGRRQDKSEVQALLRELALGDMMSRYPHELSQGQAQRVAVARAVINAPKLLLADEPTAALDDEQAARVVALLADRAQAVGATLAIASHDGRIRSRFEQVLALPRRPVA